jgi:hypothetical protein
MSDPEILGRPQYCSRKLKEEQKQNSSIHKESEKRPSDPDLEYERDEKDGGGVTMYDSAITE